MDAVLIMMQGLWTSILFSQKSFPFIVHFSGYVMNNYVVLVAISMLHVHLMCVFKLVLAAIEKVLLVGTATGIY